MTISSTIPKIIYLPSGTQTVFTVPFIFYTDADIVAVEKLKASPYTEETLVLNTDYTLTGGDGAVGELTVSTATPSTKKLIIYSSIDDKQAVNYINNSTFDQEVLEESLDKIVRMIQQKGETIDRCLKMDVGSENAEVPTDGSGYLYYDGSTYSLDDLNYTTTNYAGTITAGVDASKPTSPTAKDIYYALDTQKNYFCRVGGTWDYDGVFDDLTVDGALGVTGAATLASTLAVTGNVTVGGGVTVTGSVNLGGNLSIDGSPLIGSILDEDNMVSDSATSLATQQSIKAYIDSLIPSSDVIVKAYAHVDSDGTVLDGYNVASVTANGSGDYDVNFTNNMASVNYAVAGSTYSASSFFSYNTKAAGTVNVVLSASTNSKFDIIVIGG